MEPRPRPMPIPTFPAADGPDFAAGWAVLAAALVEEAVEEAVLDVAVAVREDVV